MESSNPVREKSYTFAVRIAKYCLKLQHEKREFVLTKQLLKSGTSIGANIEEGLQGQSRADFVSKLSIALKEACETQYWLRLLRDVQIASSSDILSLLHECTELVRLLTAILKTSREK